VKGLKSLDCQSAFNIDPVSASNIDPPLNLLQWLLPMLEAPAVVAGFDDVAVMS
jgi:hypothetical protein